MNQQRGPLSFFFLATFILILSAITASAATYYVSPSGSDSNSGALASPWRTIQRAADAVSPGDVVQVAPGTFPETILSRRGGTATARIRFVSTTKWGAKIVSSTTGGGAAWQNEASYVDIEGFEVTGQAAYGIRNQKASYTRIVGNHVHDIPALNCVPGGGLAEGGYSAVPMPSNNEYAGNLVHHIGPAPGTCNQSHGIYLTLPYAKAYNNIVYNSAGRGIQLYHAITNAVVMNNTLFGSGDGIVVNSVIAMSITAFTAVVDSVPAIRLRITWCTATARTGALCRTRTTLWATRGSSMRRGAISPATIASVQPVRASITAPP